MGGGRSGPVMKAISAEKNQMREEHYSYNQKQAG